MIKSFKYTSLKAETNPERRVLWQGYSMEQKGSWEEYRTILKYFWKGIWSYELTKVLPCENQQGFPSCHWKKNEVGKLHKVIYCFCLILFFIDGGEGGGRGGMESSDLKYKTTSTITQLYMVNPALPSDRRKAKSFIALDCLCLQTLSTFNSTLSSRQ